MQTSDAYDIEGRLCLAIDALKTNKIKTLRQASRTYDIPYTRLNR
jgi:hypothetical protein